MRDPAFRVEIGRIVLSGLDVGPDGAERIRGQLEAELRHRLQRGGLPQGMSGGRVDRLRVPETRLPRPRSDGSLAGALASSISDALGRANPSERR